MPSQSGVSSGSHNALVQVDLIGWDTISEEVT